MSQSISNNNGRKFEDFGSVGNLAAALNSEVVYVNQYGASTISFHLTIPTGATVVFEGSVDGITYTGVKIRSMDTDEYNSSATVSSPYIGSISSLRMFRVRVSVAGSASGSVIGRASEQMSTLEGVEFENLPRYLTLAVKGTSTSPIRRITALGNNPVISTATVPEDIWPLGGVYPFLSAASALEILSSSVNDTSAGTGARTVLINGLDGNYDEVAQTVTLNGTTPVSIPTALLRVNSAIIMTAGSTEINAGNITIRDTATTTARAYIQAGAGITRSSIYTVPNGYTLVVNSMVFTINRSANTNDAIEVVTHVRSSLGVYREPLILGIDIRTAPYRHDGEPGITVVQKSDFTLRVTFTQNPNVNVTAGWLGVLVKNTLSL